MVKYQEISGHSTPRKCYMCQGPAVEWKFKANKTGGIDKSSKKPVCADHIGEK